MRAVLQRVSSATVSINDAVHGAIERGLLILFGVETGDTDADAAWLSKKIAQLRIFPDDAGLMNLSIVDAGGQALVVSQFTLHASCKKGNRPSFLQAAKPDEAIPLYEAFVRQCEALTGRPVPTGVFGADMRVALVNDGPVTIILDSRRPE